MLSLLNAGGNAVERLVPGGSPRKVALAVADHGHEQALGTGDQFSGSPALLTETAPVRRKVALQYGDFFFYSHQRHATLQGAIGTMGLNAGGHDQAPDESSQIHAPERGMDGVTEDTGWVSADIEV
jgi:hypothetical protein